jgi:hypothetical protein
VNWLKQRADNSLPSRADANNTCMYTKSPIRLSGAETHYENISCANKRHLSVSGLISLSCVLWIDTMTMFRLKCCVASSTTRRLCVRFEVSTAVSMKNSGPGYGLKVQTIEVRFLAGAEHFPHSVLTDSGVHLASHWMMCCGLLRKWRDRGWPFTSIYCPIHPHEVVPHYAQGQLHIAYRIRCVRVPQQSIPYQDR